MNALFIALGAAILYLAAYHTYGKFLARKIFKLNSEAVCPSKEFEDNMDFVPTKKRYVVAELGNAIGISAVAKKNQPRLLRL